MVRKMAMAPLRRGKRFSVLFSVCAVAAKRKLLVSAANADLAFISRGLANWEEAKGERNPVP